MSPKSRIRRQTDTEKRLFDAALRVFAEKGRYGASVQDIAEVAGITKASLHYYFRHKDDLYDAAFGYVLNEVARSLFGALRPGMSFADTLRTFCTSAIDYYTTHPFIVKLWVQECLNGGEVAGRYLNEIGWDEASPLGTFIANVRAAIASGEIRRVDPYQLFVTTLSSCAFIFVAYPTLSKTLPPLRESPEAFMTARREHVFAMLYHGVATPPATGGKD